MKHDKPLLIGLSARMLYNTPENFEIKKKTIQYLEQSLTHLVARHGSLVVMVPSLEGSEILNKEDLNPYHYAEALDGLVLQGGVDISPSMYNEEVIEVNKHIMTDPIRDRYELKLLKAFTAKKKPVLGICRGFQLMNIFKGGSLFQDLPTQRMSEVVHNKFELYDDVIHKVEVQPEGMLSQIYPHYGDIVSIHHQGVKELGKNLRVEAISDDGLIESFSSTEDSFYLGVQWHPEFHKPEDPRYLGSEPLIKMFLDACKKRRWDQRLAQDD
jgi:gamma-glutamyl-gamma-aminobutyrate hydrolase PuuD